MSLKPWLGMGVLLGAAVLAPGCACSDGDASNGHAGTGGADGGTGGTTGVTDLWSAWERLRDGVRKSPDHLPAAAEAAVASKDSVAIFELVRDRVATYPPSSASFESVESAVRWGTRGTLRGGAGTPREKAELLAELYQKAGFEAEVVAGHADPAKLGRGPGHCRGSRRLPRRKARASPLRRGRGVQGRSQDRRRARPGDQPHDGRVARRRASAPRRLERGGAHVRDGAAARRSGDQGHARRPPDPRAAHLPAADLGHRRTGCPCRVRAHPPATAGLAIMEAEMLSGTSTHETLAGQTLNAFNPLDVASQPGLTDEQMLAWAGATKEFNSEYTLLAPLAPSAFWAVHEKTGTVIGVSLNGLGEGVDDVCNGYDLQNLIGQLVGLLGTFLGVEVGPWVALAQWEIKYVTMATLVLCCGASPGELSNPAAEMACGMINDALGGASSLYGLYDAATGTYNTVTGGNLPTLCGSTFDYNPCGG